MYKKRDVVYEKKVLIKQFIKIELKARQQILLMSFIMLLLFFENDNGLFYLFFFNFKFNLSEFLENGLQLSITDELATFLFF